MNLFEEVVLSLGSSWQFSRLFPFVLLFISSFLIIVVLREKIKQKKLKWFLRLGILLIPTSLYFAVNPIFESDLYDLSREINVKSINSLAKDEFVVFTLPNCPFCLETISLIALLKKRNPDLTVTYKIVTSGGGGDVESILKKNRISFELLNKSEQIELLTLGSYPTFVFNTGAKVLKIWDNNSFGTKALDFIEDHQR